MAVTVMMPDGRTMAVNVKDEETRFLDVKRRARKMAPKSAPEDAVLSMKVAGVLVECADDATLEQCGVTSGTTLWCRPSMEHSWNSLKSARVTNEFMERRESLWKEHDV